MMQVKVRHEDQSAERAVPFCWVQPGTDPGELVDRIRDEGGISYRGRNYCDLSHQFVLGHGGCYLELVLSDAEFSGPGEGEPGKTRRRRAAKK